MECTIIRQVKISLSTYLVHVENHVTKQIGTLAIVLTHTSPSCHIIRPDWTSNFSGEHSMTKLHIPMLSRNKVTPGLEMLLP